MPLCRLAILPASLASLRSPRFVLLADSFCSSAWPCSTSAPASARPSLICRAPSHTNRSQLSTHLIRHGRERAADRALSSSRSGTARHKYGHTRTQACLRVGISVPRLAFGLEYVSGLQTRPPSQPEGRGKHRISYVCSLDGTEYSHELLTCAVLCSTRSSGDPHGRALRPRVFACRVGGTLTWRRKEQGGPTRLAIGVVFKAGGEYKSGGIEGVRSRRG